MKVKFTATAVLAVAGLGWLAWRALRVEPASNDPRGALTRVADGLNPTNRDNWINQAANYIWGGGRDGKGTIGTDIYEWLHDDELEAMARRN